MGPSVAVFVSSTWLDLRAERQALEAVLQRFRATKYVGMEYFGSSDEATRESSLSQVDRSNLCVLIIGGRYGSGITEAEYRRAIARHLPCLVYFKSPGSLIESDRDAEQEQRQRLVAFKQELRERHLVSEFDDPHDLASRVASDLHNWLFDTFLASRLDGSSDEPLSAAVANGILHSLRHVEDVSRDLLARLQAAATEDGTGRLVDCVYDFAPLIADVTKRFVGREFALQRFSAFLRERDRGYFCVVAEAGLGKTALAAAFAARYRCPAFFANRSAGLTRAEQSLRHLSAELIQRFALSHSRLPARAGDDSQFLYQVVCEATHKAVGPVILIVDALDEADPPGPGQNPLMLPDHLPQGAYVIVTYRPGMTLLTTAPDVAIDALLIERESGEQLADIEQALRARALEPAIIALCAAFDPPLLSNEFIARLATASEGNFKYLEYVLLELEGAVRAGGTPDLDGLPKGLEGYYAHFWTSMQGVGKADGWKDWKELYKPALAYLTVAAEPVEADWLALHIGRDSDEMLERVLEPWMRFLSHTEREGRHLFRFVHRSFADFLASKLDLDATHRAIAARYQADMSSWDRNRGYAYRHLAAHLRAAGDASGLFALVQNHAWQSAQAAFDVTGATLISDLSHAWAMADDAVLKAASPVDRGRALAQSLHCALTSATISGRSARFTPHIVQQLVMCGMWTPTQALNIADQTGSLEIIRLLAEQLSDAALEQALAIVEQSDERTRATAIAALAPRLPLRSMERAWSMLLAQEDITIPAKYVNPVVRHLPDERIRQLVDLAGTGKRFWFRVHGLEVLASVAERLTPQERSRLLTGLLQREDLHYVGRVLLPLVPHLSVEESRRATAWIGDAVRKEMESPSPTWDDVLPVLGMLEVAEREKVAARIWKSAEHNAEQSDDWRWYTRCSLQTRLCRWLTEARQAETLNAVSMIVDIGDRIGLLIEFAQSVDGVLGRRALTDAVDALDKIAAPLDRTELALQLAVFLETAERNRLMERCISDLARVAPPERISVARRVGASLGSAQHARRMLALLLELPPTATRDDTIAIVIGCLPRDERRAILIKLLTEDGAAPIKRSSVEAGLHAMLGDLPAERFSEVLDSLVEQLVRDVSFAVVASLSPDRRTIILERALAAAQREADLESRLCILAQMIPYLDGALRTTAVQLVLNAYTESEAQDESELIDSRVRLDILFRLLPFLNPGDPRRIRWLDAAGQVVSHWEDTSDMIENSLRAALLWRFLTLISADDPRKDSLVEEVERRLSSWSANEDFLTAKNIALLLPYLSEEGRRMVCDKAFEALTCTAEQGWVEMDEHLVALCARELFEEVLKRIRRGEQTQRNMQLLGKAVAHIELAQLESSMNFTDEHLLHALSWSGSLNVLADRLPPERVGELLTVARRLDSDEERSLLVSHIAPRLPDTDIASALELSRSISQPRARAESLIALVPRLSTQRESVLMEALEAARAMPADSDAACRAEVLAKVSRWLSPGLRSEIAGEAIDLAITLEEWSLRQSALLDIAACLNEPALFRVIDVLRRNGSASECRRALTMLLEHQLSSEASGSLRLALALAILHDTRSTPDTIVSAIVELWPYIRAAAGQEAATVASGALIEVWQQLE